MMHINQVAWRLFLVDLIVMRSDFSLSVALILGGKLVERDTLNQNQPREKI